MAKITFANKESIITNDVIVTGQWRAIDANEVKNSVNALYDNFGWERYFDVTNTEESPQALLAVQDNTITIDGATSILTESPIIPHAPFWSGNKIRPILQGDTYLIRFDFKAKISNANGWYEFSLNVGGSIGKILIGTYTFPKGSNVEHSFSVTHSIYSLDTFIANGGQLLINPSHTMSIYSKSIYIERNYFSRT
jgi:hypothetical protein